MWVGLFLNQFLDAFDVFQGVVDGEGDFGNDPELVFHAFPEFEADGAGVVVQGGEDRGAFVEGENAEVDFRKAEVGADAYFRYGDHGALYEMAGFFQEDVAEVFLYLAADFLLSGGLFFFHIYSVCSLSLAEREAGDKSKAETLRLFEPLGPEPPPA